MKGPLVSIVIPVHNRAYMVCDALASIRAQTYSYIETIVVDDGSTDNSFELVESFPMEKRTFRLEPAQGPSAARNFGIEKADGDYVLFLDDDDLIHPKHIEELVRRTKGTSGAAAICGRWRRFLIDKGKIAFGPVIGDRSVPNNDWLVGIVNPCGEGRIALMACLWPKEVCFKVRWDEELFTNGDVDFYGRSILAGYKFIAVDAGMAYYRSHPGPQVAGTYSERSLRSSTSYRFKLCEQLKYHANRHAYAPGIRRSLLSLAISWGGIPGNEELVKNLVEMYREWGGRKLEVPVPPRNSIKRVIATALLRFGGPIVLGRLMRLNKRLGMAGKSLPVLQDAPNLRDEEDLHILKNLLHDFAESA